MEITRREVRFAVHIPATDFNSDYHYVKEMITFSDGTMKPKVSMIENYMMKLFVTKENKRNHKEKKEFELLENLAIKESTESDRVKTYANMLGDDYLIKYPNLIAESPYVYAGDITAASSIKLESLVRNNFIQSAYTIVGFDLETTTDANKKLLCGSIVAEKPGGGYVAYLLGMHDWLKEYKNDEEISYFLDIANKQYAQKDYGDIEIIYKTHTNEIEFLKDIFGKANEWSPDFLEIWNQEFDIFEIVIPLCNKYGVRVEDVVCDPRLPPELRIFKAKQASKQKKKSSGEINPVHPADRWHKITSTSSFQIIDGMCARRSLRVHEGRTSYALDYTAMKLLKIGKLRIPKAAHLDGAAWHDFMQAVLKIEYMIYNIVDNIAMLMIDKETKDLSNSIPIFSEITDFNDYGSSDRKNYNALFIYGLSKGKIIGTSLNVTKLKEKHAKKFPHNELYFKSVLDTKDWIQTLPQGNFLNEGLKLFKDFPWLITNARGNVTDIDSVSSYPTATSVFNVSRSTTVCEVISVKGYKPEVFRQQFLGCVIGNTNAVEFSIEMFGLTTLEEWFDRADAGEFN